MQADIPKGVLAGGASGPSGNRSLLGSGTRCVGGGRMPDADRARSGRAVGV